MADKFESLLKEFNNEVHRLISCYLLWRTFNQRISDNKRLLEKLNTTPLSWIIIRHSLQMNIFIILGRLFDDDSRAFTANKMLKLCVSQIEIFSTKELRKRKIKDNNGTEPHWLEEYINKKTELNSPHFNVLSRELKVKKKIYNKKYKPIRNKLFAHKQEDMISSDDDLWAKTNIDEFEELVLFFHRLKDALFQTYYNGELPEIKKEELDLDYYKRDFESFIDSQQNA